MSTQATSLEAINRYLISELLLQELLEMREDQSGRLVSRHQAQQLTLLLIPLDT